MKNFLAAMIYAVSGSAVYFGRWDAAYMLATLSLILVLLPNQKRQPTEPDEGTRKRNAA